VETLFGIVFTKFMVYFGEELATFGYVVGVFLLQKFQLNFKNFCFGRPPKVKPFLCLTSLYTEGCWRCRPGDEG